jgi:PhnB protein
MTTLDRRMTNEEQVRAVMDDWAEALRTKNAGGVIRHHAGDFVLFSVAPPLVSRTDPRDLETWLATWRGPIGYEIRALTVTVGGDVAFCPSLNKMIGTKRDGEAVELWFRQTLGLRNTAAGWKITHAHESVPFHMDGSLKAATDLEP